MPHRYRVAIAVGIVIAFASMVTATIGQYMLPDCTDPWSIPNFDFLHDEMFSDARWLELTNQAILLKFLHVFIEDGCSYFAAGLLLSLGFAQVERLDGKLWLVRSLAKS